MVPFVAKNGKMFGSEAEYVQWLETEHERLTTTVKNNSKKNVELLIEHETGFLQIRRLTSRSINLPVWVIAWLFDHGKEVLEFIKNHSNLLAAKDDTSVIQTEKLLLRSKSLETDNNSVVRKPRAENKTESQTT